MYHLLCWIIAFHVSLQLLSQLPSTFCSSILFIIQQCLCWRCCNCCSNGINNAPESRRTRPGPRSEQHRHSRISHRHPFGASSSKSRYTYTLNDFSC
jgi:hypothetical protein